MSRRIKLWSLVALVVAVSLVGVPAVLAGAPAGSGPDNALAPAAGAVQLAPGQQQWYAFNSSQAPSDANNKQIMVRLAANPPDSTTFSVWTKNQALAMLAGDTNAKPVGMGTVNVSTDSNGNKFDRFNGDQVWISSSRAAEQYYVVVQSHAAKPSTYTLAIDGNYVSFPTAAATSQPSAAASQAPAATSKPALATSQPAVAARATPLPPTAVKPAAGQTGQPAAAASPQAAPARSTPLPPQAAVVKPAASPTAAASASASNGTSNPYAIDGATRQLGLGQQHWYALPSPGRNASGNQVLLSLELLANPAGSATFNVWDRRGLERAGAGDANARPIGGGTLHPVTRDGNTVDRFGGNLQWSGNLVDAGTYYVEVQQKGPAPSTYALQLKQQ